MTDRPSPIAAVPTGGGSAATAQVPLNTQSPWAVPISRSRDGHPDGLWVYAEEVRSDPPLNVERLARMASVEGQWWQDCDRQMKRRATIWRYWLYGLMGAGIGLAIGAAGVAYQTLG